MMANLKQDKIEKQDYCRFFYLDRFVIIHRDAKSRGFSAESDYFRKCTPMQSRNENSDRLGRNASRRGLFIVLDGPDGGGKSTQAHLLTEWMRNQGYEVTLCVDPGGTPLGAKVRRLLLDRSSLDISARAEMMLYLASRAQLVNWVIAPALAAGKVVISDRYLLSTIAYQGVASEIGSLEAFQCSLIAVDGLIPDLTLILDVPIEVTRSRNQGARDRIESRPDAYHEKVREGFRSFARIYKTIFPGPNKEIEVLNATASIEEVHGSIVKAISDRTLFRSRQLKWIGQEDSDESQPCIPM